MQAELLKLIAPVALVILWLNFARRKPSVQLAGAALFFTSIAAFSQNFSLFYRELHQAIQVCLVLLFGATALRTKQIHKYNVLFIGLLFFIGISLAFSRFDHDARAQLLNIALAIGVTNFLFCSISREIRFRLLIEFVSRLTVLLAALGLVEFGGALTPRIEVTFSNPNYLAFFLGVGYCLISYEMRGWRRIASMALVLVAIILSGSRAALAFPVLHFAWYTYRSENLGRSLIYAVAVVVAIFGALASGLTRFSDTDASEASDAERVIFAKIAYDMANEHPLTGVGWGRFVSEFASYSTAADRVVISRGIVDVSQNERRVTHNDLLRILAELGWAALVVSVVALSVGFLKLVANRKHEHSFIFPVWTGTVLFSLTHNNMNGALFWFLFLLPFYFFRAKSPGLGE